MPHKLRLLVKLDTEPTTATLAVTGCLTENNCLALLPIIRRLRAMVDGMTITVDLSTAKHVEAAAVRILEEAGPEVAGYRGGGKAFLTLPTVLPSCQPVQWDA